MIGPGSDKKNIGNIFGEVGWFAGCRTTLVPAEKKWKRQTFNSSNCEICFPNIFHQKFLLKGTQESGNSYILQKAKVKASNVKVVRDNKIGVFWFPSFPVAIKFVFFSFLQFRYMTFKFPACTKLWSNTDGQIKSFGQPCPWASSCLPGMGTFKSSQHKALSYLRQQEFG